MIAPAETTQYETTTAVAVDDGSKYMTYAQRASSSISTSTIYTERPYFFALAPKLVLVAENFHARKNRIVHIKNAIFCDQKILLSHQNGLGEG